MTLTVSPADTRPLVHDMDASLRIRCGLVPTEPTVIYNGHTPITCPGCANSVRTARHNRAMMRDSYARQIADDLLEQGKFDEHDLEGYRRLQAEITVLDRLVGDTPVEWLS